MHRALASLALTALLAAAPSLALATSLPFGSAHALVMDEATGEVLMAKDADTQAPIASITKLVTAMVVIDAGLDLQAPIEIDVADMDTFKHTRAGLPVGAVLERGALLELALIASDNHAAAALARTFPGGLAGFRVAVQTKLAALGLTQALIEEPTGLSPRNRASATDLAVVLRAASGYERIAAITSSPTHSTLVNGRPWEVRNTNGLVGKPGWVILTSKTGYTQEAGRCLVMRVQSAGRTLLVVLMGAARSAQRFTDATNVLRWLAGEPLLAQAQPRAGTRSAKRLRRATARHALASAHS
ncbi:serine hydrolase [Methylibium sp.]|uniref:D-alanyl-D-alanine carboxypeptidase family protein n=1 Tax=Methylibium sp. TaxID=2067992 RepID=UPI002869F175|nr:serine hydrolase [Methylibium sp.]